MRVREPKKQSPRKVRPPKPSPRRFSPFGLMRNLTLAMTGGALLVGAFAGYAFWRSGPRFLEGLKLMVTPSPPQETVDVRTVVVQQIEDASELTTAVFSMEVVVPTASDRTFGGYTIGKTNLLYIAYGEVRAGLDLSEISAADVTVSPAPGPESRPESGPQSRPDSGPDSSPEAGSDGQVILTLPAPRILDSKLDLDQSRVYDYSRGLFGLGPDRAPQLQSLAQTTALQKIERAACEQGILKHANERAELVVSRLVQNLNYGQVTVKTQLPATCGSSDMLAEPTAPIGPTPAESATPPEQ
ncbi:MAG: DUF4230 domain-containing protein [Cyanobacteria bacterium P01_A01_bin.114]